MNLVLSPHPDDAEYSVSGTILKSTDEWKIATLSAGGDNDDTAGSSRLVESESFWSLYPVEHVGIDYKTIDEMRDHELVSLIDDLVKGVDTIYVPPLEDNHFEHRKISGAARAATRGKAITLIEYHTPSTKSVWNPNLFVDVTDYYEIKRKRIYECFESQRNRFYFSEKNIEIFHEDYFCRLRGLDKVEKFRVEYQFK
jgi:LmbE family N-acetylglucosaminyl deacetylase